MGQIDGGLVEGGGGEMVPCIVCEFLHQFQYTWNDEYFSFFFNGQVRKKLRDTCTCAHHENKG